MWFTKLSLQKKIYLSCLILNFILLTACCLIFYRYTTDSLRDNMQDTITSNTTLLSRELDSKITTANNSLKELQTNESLMAIAKKISSESSNYFTQNASERFLFRSSFQSVLVSQGIHASIAYISQYYDEIGMHYSSGTLPSVGKEQLQEISEIEDLMDDFFYAAYIPPHADYWKSDRTVFSVVRAMRDNYNKYGLLILNYDVSMLTKLLEDLGNTDGHSITLLNSDGEFLYSTDADLDRTLFLESYQSADADHIFSYSNNSISCATVSETTGWVFVVTHNIDSYLASLKDMFLISIVLFASLFLVTLLFLSFVTNSLTKPLQNLVTQLHDLNPGENITIIEDHSSNELAVLTNSVQNFLSEIYAQNQLLTEARQRTLQAHYDAMEAQLNPHFLYNTLSVIGMTALTSGSETAFNMCNELASQLHYSLSYTRQSVHLEQEITNAQSYLYIMNQRFVDDLQAEWNIDESLNAISVPKLILQPLVENCFQHGFRDQEHSILPPWKIKIRSYQDGAYWYLAITDNGIPFDRQKQEHLYQRIEQFKRPEHLENNMETVLQQGFGLENSILRLCIYYDGKEYFHIDSTPQETTITIGGPLYPQKVFNRL